MAKHPKRHDNDVDDEHEEKMESHKQREADKAKIQEENKANEAYAKETAENQELANFRGLPQEGETRDQLLARIRKLREEGAKIQEGTVDVEPFRSEGQQKEYDAEVKAGQEAVAKAAAEMERAYGARQQEPAGEKNKA